MRYGGRYVLCETTTAQVLRQRGYSIPVLIETLRLPMSAVCCQTVSPTRRSPPTTIDARNMNAISPTCHEPSRPFPGRRNRAGVRQSVNRCRNLLSRMPETGRVRPSDPAEAPGPVISARTATFASRVGKSPEEPKGEVQP